MIRFGQHRLGLPQFVDVGKAVRFVKAWYKVPTTNVLFKETSIGPVLVLPELSKIYGGVEEILSVADRYLVQLAKQNRRWLSRAAYLDEILFQVSGEQCGGDAEMKYNRILEWVESGA